jgi:adenylate cyclase
MTGLTPPEEARFPDPVARPAARRWAKPWARIKRFRGLVAGAVVVVLALLVLAFVQLPTVWQAIVTVASVGAVLSGLAGYWNTYHAVKKGVPQSEPTSVPVADSALSIVVLPFQNLTGDAAQGYVADGLTSSLTADLSRISDAFIIDAATAYTYKDKPVTAQQIGKDLGVRFVLLGGVQRNGIKIRINAQLADASSNALLWSESFEGDQSDLFALQDQVTARIGNSIGREMVIVAARESETRQTSPNVADLILRARALGLQPSSLQNYQQIEDLYRRVLALEPCNVNAMIGLAQYLAIQVDNFPVQLKERVKEKKLVEARDLALKVKELDPDNIDVYVVMGTYAYCRGDFSAALRAAESRLALGPRDPGAYLNLAHCLFYAGQPKRAIELLSHAIDLRPKRPHEFVFLMMGLAHFMRGENGAAIEWLQKCIERNPKLDYAYAYLAMAHALNGDDAQAHTAAAETRRLSPEIKLTAFDNPVASSSAAYKSYYEKTVVPAWRKAGLPE